MGNKIMKIGINANPKNFNVLENRFETNIPIEVGLAGSGSTWVEVSIRFDKYEVEGEVIKFNVWLVKPSISFDSILMVAVGRSISIKIKMKIGNLM